MKVKLLPKLILFALVVGGGVGLFRHLVYTGVIPRPSALKSLIPVKAEEIRKSPCQRGTWRHQLTWEPVCL
jgi:hypothetical protein